MYCEVDHWAQCGPEKSQSFSPHGKVREKVSFTKLFLGGRSRSPRMFWYHFLFMDVFLGKFVSEPTPLAEKQPHTSVISGCFDADMTKD